MMVKLVGSLGSSRNSLCGIANQLSPILILLFPFYSLFVVQNSWRKSYLSTCLMESKRDLFISSFSKVLKASFLFSWFFINLLTKGIAVLVAIEILNIIFDASWHPILSGSFSIIVESRFLIQLSKFLFLLSRSFCALPHVHSCKSHFSQIFIYLLIFNFTFLLWVLPFKGPCLFNLTSPH